MVCSVLILKVLIYNLYKILRNYSYHKATFGTYIEIHLMLHLNITVLNDCTYTIRSAYCKFITVCN